ncbi:hypothetical protein [Brachyspira sp.]|uniref:hypothetical protein n=1 Tax=Brachyspira sp. TaxID=1977261 RepID=UPI0026093CD6|nr:hypothetical protein [Brachyspira sp.]
MSKKKILYNTQNIHELIRDNSGVLEIDSNVILTPSAMDIIKTKGITIVYKKESICNNNNNNCSYDDIIKSITKILIYKYNITDEKIIKKVIVEVLKEIN